MIDEDFKRNGVVIVDSGARTDSSDFRMMK
jgi:hypothetical protein